MSKTCSGCGAIKPLSEFYKRLDAHQPICKLCSAAANKRYREVAREKLRAYEKVRRDLPHRKAARADYYQEHKEQAYLSGRASLERNRAAHNARGRAWNAANPQYMREYKREWAKLNPHRLRAYELTRRTAEKRQMPAWVSVSDFFQIYEARRVAQDLSGIEVHVDHIIPLRGKTVSGLHVPENLQLLTASQNHSKRNFFAEAA